MFMTLRQEAYEKMAGLSDDSLRLVLALVEEMRRQSNVSDADAKRAALRNIMEYSRQHPFPKDFDWEKAREEAMIEKYGRFD